MGTANDSKAIILFSDGTGNGSAKLFKTNVWRLYEAIDLGPAPAGGGREQIAYYSNGVGTSGFRPLALLGGIFGYGLKANILDLYKYLCRNYRDGDTIHVFGFSRGSFTVRLLVGLIVSQGILRGDSPDVAPDEDKLAYLARAAYRAFAREAWPNRWLAKQVARTTRRVRDGILDLHRRATGRDRYDPPRNVMTDVAFVGVWDTVAAYGGPIVEITRGIDDWIWPLTMPNYQLSPRVLQARHALSLDDERDSFQPLLWDEVREDMLVRQGGFVKEIIEGHVVETVRKVPRGRLKQVWFAGMHADVGGGYPDESLSYVSLLWMIQELDGSLRMIGPLVERVRSMANIFGPIHDSRAGLGAYYRYQPRRIAAMLEGPQDNPAFVATRALRDPAIADAGYVMPGGSDPSTASGVDHDPHLAQLARRIRSDHGLLREVRIHESVLARIAEGTDGYAPIGLPRVFDVEFAGELQDDGSGERQARWLEEGFLDRICTDREMSKRIVSPGGNGVADAWLERQATIWDMVWKRRILYFLTVGFSVWLVAIPLWGPFFIGEDEGPCADSRCIVRPVLALAERYSAGLAHPWVDAISHNMAAAMALLGAIGALLAYGRPYELRLRGRARRAWRIAAGMASAGPWQWKRSRIDCVHDGAVYQYVVHSLKWTVGPSFCGLSIIASILWLGGALITQLAILPLEERHGVFCDNSPLAPILQPGTSVMQSLAIATPCSPLGIAVERGKTYAIRVTVGGGGPWYDGVYRAGPGMGQSAQLPVGVSLPAIPYRRVILSGWLQPMFEIKEPVRTESWPGRIWHGIFGWPAFIQPLYLRPDRTGGFNGRFTAHMTGNLYFFVNDAMLAATPASGWPRLRPALPGGLYGNNVGTAQVKVASTEEIPATGS